MGTIKGASNRYTADVDSTNRLLTRSVSKSEVVDAILRGDGYAVLAQNVTLTSANRSTVVFYQNDEERDLIVFDTNISCSDSTGGTSETVAVDINVGIGNSMTGGSGNPLLQSNLVIGNPSQLINTSELGQEGADETDTNEPDRNYVKTGMTSNLDLYGVVPKGSQYFISVTPPPGNTNMRVDITAFCYLALDDD